jgi:hypothetical protein
MQKLIARLIIALALALLAVTAFAQTHPCDQPPVATITLLSGAPHKLQFCVPQSDNVEAVIGFVDTTAFDLVAVTVRTATPNAGGLILLESAPFIQVPKGQHQVYAKAYNRNALTGELQVGAASLPLPFAAVDDTPPAAAPKLMNVIK